MANEFVVNSGIIVQSNSTITGSLIVTQGITGSLSGSAISASYATTASSVNTLNQSVTITGSLTVYGGATIFGSSSFTYITASQISVSSSTISVNVFEPLQRFGGLLVYDSGSSNATASLLWDSLNNNFIYQNASGSTYSGGMLMSGPRNTGSLGNEQSLTKWFIARSDGGDHLNDTQIYSSGSVTQVTGSLTVTAGITGSLQGTASWAQSSSQALTASYVVTAQTASYVLTAQTASYVQTAQTASYAVTASYVTGSIYTSTNPALSASYALTASYALNAGASGGGSNVSASFSNLSTWTFTHNMNSRYVVIQTLDSSFNQIIPQSVTLTDANTATITFPTAISGYAIASLGGVGSAAATATSASYATTSSYAATSSYLNPLNQTTTITGSVNISGSITVISGSVTMPQRSAFRVTGNSITGIPAITTISSSATIVDYNQNNNYNNTTGLYTAPIAGLYHVFFNCRTQTAGGQQVIIYKNTNIAQLMWETNTNTGHFGVSGVLQLAANDTLQARVMVGTVQFDGNDSWGVAYIG